MHFPEAYLHPPALAHGKRFPWSRARDEGQSHTDLYLEGSGDQTLSLASQRPWGHSTTLGENGENERGVQGTPYSRLWASTPLVLSSTPHPQTQPAPYPGFHHQVCSHHGSFRERDLRPESLGAYLPPMAVPVTNSLSRPHLLLEGALAELRWADQRKCGTVRHEAPRCAEKTLAPASESSPNTRQVYLWGTNGIFCADLTVFPLPAAAFCAHNAPAAGKPQPSTSKLSFSWLAAAPRLEEGAAQAQRCSQLFLPRPREVETVSVPHPAALHRLQEDARGHLLQSAHRRVVPEEGQ